MVPDVADDVVWAAAREPLPSGLRGPWMRTRREILLGAFLLLIAPTTGWAAPQGSLVSFASSDDLDVILDTRELLTEVLPPEFADGLRVMRRAGGGDYELVVVQPSAESGPAIRP